MADDQKQDDAVLDALKETVEAFALTTSVIVLQMEKAGVSPSGLVSVTLKGLIEEYAKNDARGHERVLVQVLQRIDSLVGHPQLKKRLKLKVTR